MIIKSRFVKFCFLSIALFFSCEKNDTILSTSSNPFAIPKAGVYQYSGYDSLGTLIVQGKIRFFFSDSMRIRGTWNLTPVGHPGGIGLQIGSDTLLGTYSNSRFGIDLNPQIRDNNVSIFIYGQIDSQSFTGKWVWSTLRGITNYGNSLFFADSIY
jgi:hypothetical protein